MATNNTHPYSHRPLTSCGDNFFVFEEENNFSNLRFKCDGNLRLKPYFRTYTHFHIDGHCVCLWMYACETRLVIERPSFKPGVNLLDEIKIVQCLN